MRDNNTFWRRALRHPSFVAGGAMVLLMVLCAVLSLFWSPYRFDVSFNFAVFCLIVANALLVGYVIGSRLIGYL